MKKTFLIFILLVLLLIIAKLAYNKYCESKPNGCKKEIYDKKQGMPEEGVDW